MVGGIVKNKMRPPALSTSGQGKNWFIYGKAAQDTRTYPVQDAAETDGDGGVK
jgi:hypothetical protein